MNVRRIAGGAACSSRRIFRLSLFLPVLLSACSTTYLDQDHWKDEVNTYNSKDIHKALALDLDHYDAYMVWGRQDQTTAQNDVMANCKAKHDNCKLVASDGTLLYDVSQEYQGSKTDWGAVALDVLTLGAAAANGYAAGANNSHMSYSSGTGSGNCQQFLDLANQCKRNQQNMGSPGTAANGTTGQAGAFDECYNNYMGGYRACMASQ